MVVGGMDPIFGGGLKSSGVTKSMVFDDVGKSVAEEEFSIATPFVSLRRPSNESLLVPLQAKVGLSLKLFLADRRSLELVSSALHLLRE